MIRLKICGITRLSDAQAAASLGASAIGFNFYQESPRYIEPETAGQIIRELPPFISAVGIVVNADADRIDDIIDRAHIDTLQFHGDETPEFCAQFERVRTIKAFRIKNEDDLTSITDYQTNGYLLDAYHPEQYGGSGISFSWDILASLDISNPVIIAGGITAKNVTQLLAHIRPYGIDVCSGVESAPGVKDHTAMRKLASLLKI